MMHGVITSEQLWRAFAKEVSDLCLWDMPVSDAENAKEENIRVLFFIEGLRTMTEALDKLIKGAEKK